jgi:hypothetical protein
VKRAGALGAGILSFVLVAVALHVFLPPPMTLRQAKLAAFEARRDEYTLIFVGTSLVHRQIIPPLFDQEIERRGIPMRSFNFGLMGAHPGEIYWILEQVLCEAPAKLRYVVIDADLPEPHEKNTSTWRYITWHSPRATWASLSGLWRSNLGAARKIGAAGDDVRAFSQHALSVGTVWPFFKLWQKGGVGPAVGDEGYAPLDSLPEAAAQHEQFLRAPGDYQTGVASLARQPMGLDERSFPRELLVSMADLARRRGMKVIIVKGPALSGGAVVPAVEAEVVAFQDPNRYPALYALENRFDWNHLNARGAREYTRLVAAELAGHLDAVH